MQKKEGTAPPFVNLTYTVPPKSQLNGADDQDDEELESVEMYKESILSAKIKAIEVGPNMVSTGFTAAPVPGVLCMMQ